MRLSRDWRPPSVTCFASELVMSSILHLITRPGDTLAWQVIDQQRRGDDDRVLRVIDLTQGTPDYGELVEAVFASESIQVW